MFDDRMFTTLEQAAAAIGRLDAALDGHPLRRGWEFRASLEATVRQLAIDGCNLDVYRLAAILEGLRLNPCPRGGVGSDINARIKALDILWHYRAPSAAFEDRAGALSFLGAQTKGSIILGAAESVWRWVAAGRNGITIRTALPFHFHEAGLSRTPLYCLCAGDAFQLDVPDTFDAWAPLFIHALAGDAVEGLRRLNDMTSAWNGARELVSSRRSNSRLGKVVDLLAGAGLVGPAAVAHTLFPMSRVGASKLLKQLVSNDVAVEVSRRGSYKLYGLADLAYVQSEVRPRAGSPRARQRGRPPTSLLAVQAPPIPPQLNRPAATMRPNNFATDDMLLRQLFESVDRLNDQMRARFSSRDAHDPAIPLAEVQSDKWL